MDGKLAFSRSLRSILLVGLACLPLPANAQFLPPPSLPRDSFSVEIDTAATKQISTLQDNLRAGQYAEAVELLLKLTDARSDKFLEISPGRYLTPQSFADILAANLPPEGLRLYRTQVDPLAKRILDRKPASEADSELVFKRIVRQGAAGSLADEAANQLAQQAWERGEIATARSFWESLIPPAQPTAPPKLPPLFAYPDTDLDQAEIRAKLILCSALLYDFSRAERELAAYREIHPESRGELRGKQGKWTDLLAEFLNESRTWFGKSPNQDDSTFAGTASRNGLVEGFRDVINPIWSISVTQYPPLLRGRRPKALEAPRPAYFPLIDQDRVFWADDESVYAARLLDGKPLWSASNADPEHPCRIYQTPVSDRPIPVGQALEDAAAFRGLDQPDESKPFAGLPEFTITLAEGKLYTRLRTRLSPLDSSTGQGEPSRLVCLDIAKGQGKLLWEVEGTAWKDGDIVWRFEGTPLAHAGKLYVGLNSTGAKRNCAVACLNPDTGERLWIRRLGELQGIGFSLNERLSRSLITIGEDLLFYETGGGGLAALELETGEPRWIVKLPDGDPPQTGSLAPLLWDRMATPVWDRGVLYVLGNEGRSLFAVDGAGGMLIWVRELENQAQWILGISGDRVIVSGERLWGINRQNGRIDWSQGSQDVELQGFGRGLLSRSEVYWPLREELLVIDSRTGMLNQRIPLETSRGLTGGHLTAAHGVLLIAQPDRLQLYTTLPASLSQPLAAGIKP